MHLHQAAARLVHRPGKAHRRDRSRARGPRSRHAADLLELALPSCADDRESRALRDWLVALPEDVVRRRPLLAACVGWTRLTLGDLDGVEVWLDAAEAGLAAAPPPALPRTASLPEAVAGRDREIHSLPP